MNVTKDFDIGGEKLTVVHQEDIESPSGDLISMINGTVIIGSTLGQIRAKKVTLENGRASYSIVVIDDKNTETNVAVVINSESFEYFTSVLKVKEINLKEWEE